MQTATGIFSSFADAARAAEALRALGFDDRAVNVLTPGADPSAVPLETAEQPGLGRAIGGVAGGAAGAAVGMQLLTAAVAGMIPGVGPVIAVGAIAGVLAGIGGAAAGQAIEDTLTTGLPKDEVPIYEDALRRGRTVVIVEAANTARADQARTALLDAGAEILDTDPEARLAGLREPETRAAERSR